MNFSPKLMFSGLLDHARKSAQFYAITDELSRRHANCELDFKDIGMSVKVNKKIIGHISPLETPRPCAVLWRYIDCKDGSTNITPVASERTGDYA